jgi:2,3-bisphosphoglycerate-independent phosphoglycerate mutase
MIEALATKSDSKILLLVLDGVGGVPVNGKTELEAANTPNLDELTKRSITGVTDPILPGITPGSGPAHLSLFGYDPIEYQIGRGVLEALGIGIELQSDDVAARGNFCTVDTDGVIVDRRADRISTDKSKKICAKLQAAIPRIGEIEIEITPGKEHRFVLVMKGKGLDARVTETDPQKVGIAPRSCKPLVPEAAKTADTVTSFVERAKEVLALPANMLLFRGFAKLPDLPTMQERFKLRPVAIASYPMYRGLAKLVGMNVLKGISTIEDEIVALEKHWNDYDFFYVHIKQTDSFGEDGNYDAKVRKIEEVDRFIRRFTELSPDVFVITGDHSTPARLHAHSWHPNPFLLYSNWVISDSSERFTERECMRGGLGRLNAVHAMPLMLANALKLQKYGA